MPQLMSVLIRLIVEPATEREIVENCRNTLILRCSASVPPAILHPKAMQSCESLVGMRFPEDAVVREARIMQGEGGSGACVG
jgi:hypothetical protein